MIGSLLTEMRKRYWIVLWGSVGLTVCLVFLFGPFHRVLQIREMKKGQTILCAAMGEGEEFVLAFIHSVNKRPVYDTIRVEGKQLIIVKSRYDSFGAGMPENSTGNSTLKLDKDSWLEFTVNQSVPEIGFFLGWEANHSLHLKGQKIHLAQWIEPGTRLTMGLHKTSWYGLRKGRCIR